MKIKFVDKTKFFNKVSHYQLGDYKLLKDLLRNKTLEKKYEYME